MVYNIEKTGGEIKINFSIDLKEWDKFIDKAYQKQKTKINIPGFRKGHAPRNLIEKMYGKSMFVEDAFNICFKESYSKVLDENPEIYPVEEPKIDIDKIDGEGVTFAAVFAVKPEVQIGEYKGIKIQGSVTKVSKADIDAEIEKARQRLARKVEKDTAVENGDTVMLDYSGSVDGVKFEGGTAKNQELVIGSGSFIPGFEPQLIGMKKGESRDITVTFPKEYHAKELAGKDAVFAITIGSIFTKELPEVNDEFAKEVSRFDTAGDYRKDIEKRLTENAENKDRAQNENKLVEKIVENATATIPAAMIESELDYMLEDLSYRLMYMYGGMKLEDYFKHTGGSEKDYREANRADAERAVKTRLTMEKIIKAENISVSDEDYAKELAEQAEAAKKTVAEFEKTLQAGQENYIKNGILSKKLMAFLTENNEFVSTGSKKTAAKEDVAKTAAAKTTTAKTGAAKTATAKTGAAKTTAAKTTTAKTNKNKETAE